MKFPFKMRLKFKKGGMPEDLKVQNFTLDYPKSHGIYKLIYDSVEVSGVCHAKCELKFSFLTRDFVS